MSLLLLCKSITIMCHPIAWRFAIFALPSGSGPVPAVGACSQCGREFKVPLASLKRTADAQESLRKQFAEHRCPSEVEDKQMCGRYRLSRRKQLIEEHFDSISGEEDWPPRY